jgi:hypothetical protein
MTDRNRMSSKNRDDPFGGLFSFSDPLRWIFGKNSSYTDAIWKRLPSAGNGILHTVLTPGRELSKRYDPLRRYIDSHWKGGKNAGDWVDNKPGTTMGIIAAMYGAGAAGGAAGGAGGGASGAGGVGGAGGLTSVTAGDIAASAAAGSGAGLAGTAAGGFTSGAASGAGLGGGAAGAGGGAAGGGWQQYAKQGMPSQQQTQYQPPPQTPRYEDIIAELAKAQGGGVPLQAPNGLMGSSIARQRVDPIAQMRAALEKQRMEQQAMGLLPESNPYG